MTKTENILLEKAKLSRHKRGSVIHGYRTGRKNGSYGGRESTALGKLVQKGLVKIISQESHRDCRNLYSDHWTETVYEVI